MQSQEQYNELYHHGVKGMKWGVRKKSKSGTYTTINIKSPKRGGFKSQEELTQWANREAAKIHREYRKGNISTKQLNTRTKELSKIMSRESRKFNKKRMIEKGKTVTNNQQLLNMSVQQTNQFALQQAHRDSVNAALMSASLGMSGGSNPYMFGMM